MNDTTTAGEPGSRARNGRPANFPIPPLPEDLRHQGIYLNLEGDYTYLSDGYYRSVEAEHEGQTALPSPAEAIDAYVVPLALAKAKAAGIPVPDWEIVNDSAVSFRPPVLLYPVNPFSDEGQVIAEEGALPEAIKSMTMSGKYAFVCQQMEANSRVDTLRLVLGQCLKPEYSELAKQLWLTFRTPLARVKVIVTETEYLFSAIEPLPKAELTQNEKGILKDAGVWRG